MSITSVIGPMSVMHMMRLSVHWLPKSSMVIMVVVDTCIRICEQNMLSEL
jgi:hypothetical protein